MEKEITWTTGDGKKVKVEIELQTSKITDADGYKVEVECCELNVTAKVDGKMIGTGRPEKVKHPVAVAKIGKLGITEENLTKIEAAIAELEATPEWQAKLKRIENAEKADREYQKHREMMRKAMWE